MKNIRRLLSCLLLAALLLSIAAPAALADALCGIITTPTKDGAVNLRARAGVTQPIIGWALNGDDVEVVQKGNTWHKVRLLKNGRTGWIYGRYLTFTSTSPSALPSSSAPVSGSVAQVMTKYPSSKVNLRWGAGTGYGVAARFGRGTRLEILDQSGDWYKVSSGGTTGWMNKAYVSLGLNARTTARVNLRRGAGTDYSIIRTLPYGQEVTVLWVGASWSKVQVGNTTGYISNRYYTYR